jgi:hypothetical protein
MKDFPQLENYLIFYLLRTLLSFKKNEDKLSKMVTKYMLPIGLKVYPIEVEIRFPKDLNESIVQDIRRLLLPLMPPAETIAYEESDEEIHDSDFTKVEPEN